MRSAGQRGDPAERAFAAHQIGLLRLAFLLGGDHAMAEDAVAEVFARSWRGLLAGRIEDPGAYLRRALVNEVHRLGRRRALERRRLAEAPAHPGDGVDAVAERAVLVAALRSLPRRQREVLVLRYWEDWSVADTASLLGVSEGAVKTHAHRGLEAIRVSMGGTEGGS